ncbi:hypothetical protein V8J88_18740 [Massilia sp. W12]|uniref:hypothetical protein n=1 Tax=Massilia sp. W12 TaxID=3126507 RepID=UPI0030CB35F5
MNIFLKLCWLGGLAGVSCSVYADMPSNTATGEAPAAIAERKVREREEKILKSGTDKQRWADKILFSDSKKIQDLEIFLLKSENFKMQLQPQFGRLLFIQGKKTDAFDAAVPHGTKNNVCPEYQFSVIHAEPGMAVIRKTCPGFEFDAKPGKEAKFHLEVNYFLYDEATSSLTVLWRNVQTSKDGAYPEPKTLPKIHKIENGYEMNWNTLNPVYNKKFHIRTRYTSEKVNGQLQLVCRDLTAPKGEEFGVNCEYGQIPRIP